MSDGRYVGITIGPIYDTLLEASSPAAMWFASSMFSEMTRQLCNKIHDEILSDSNCQGKMYSPYYDRKEAKKINAVGKYHDRIIFYTTMSEDDLLEKMKEITSEVKEEIGRIVYEAVNEEKKDNEFFEDYLQVHYMLLNESEVEENIIRAISPYLDEMELMRTYPKASETNPLRKLFAGDENGSNRFVRESEFFKKREANKALGRNEIRLRSIEEIANCDEKNIGKKKRKYYAFVAADGDSMGATLSNLVQDPSNPKDTSLENFSHACLKYTEEGARLINDFGGMTIYAGGDDLLFLAPVENQDGQSIFKLCYEIQERFREIIDKEINLDEKNKIEVPTLSFGISIQYYKFPLYEALEKARNLLDKAKKTAGIRKDSMAVQLTKHSGQTIAFELSNAERIVVEKFIENAYESENAINSIVFAIDTYRPVFEELENLAEQDKVDQKTFTGAWLNLFDNINQAQYGSYVEEIANNYYEYLIKGVREAFDKWDELLCDDEMNESEFKRRWEAIANYSEEVKQYLNRRCCVTEACISGNESADNEWSIEYLKYLKKRKESKKNSDLATTKKKLRLIEALLRYKKFLSEEGID